jgi:hypothetical protein
MGTFEYRHDPAFAESFVNGSYALGDVRHASVDGHDILYRVGAASLDNSCCGEYACAWALVIGEALDAPTGGTDARTTSRVRGISDSEPLAEAIRDMLVEREAVGVVNFYLPPAP